MTERRLTFIDVDENPLGVWLKEDRVQLFVVDSRPELEAGELRGFVLALFATYVGEPLATRLDSARKKIGDVRDRLAATAGGDELIAALDGSLNAIEDVRHVITAAGTRGAPDPAPPARPTPAAPSERATSCAPAMRPGVQPDGRADGRAAGQPDGRAAGRANGWAAGRLKKPRATRRAGEGGADLDGQRTPGATSIGARVRDTAEGRTR